MVTILLTTLNARYHHASLGLRCLLANMAELREQTALLEFDLEQTPRDMAEGILAHRPRILGLGVYIWNVALIASLVRLLKRLQPELRIILGGPEASHEIECQPWMNQADYIVRGEGETLFPALCRAILHDTPPAERLLGPQEANLATLALPYDEYSDADLAHRHVYVESSRGCPFTCAFCLSALDRKVRSFPLPAFLQAMARLMDRGARQFRFVDRTFNLSLEHSLAILDFFRRQLADHPDLFLHFEMIPDHFPARLRETVEAFPPGTLQFEVGLQSFDATVQERIARKQDLAATEANLLWLRRKTGVHLHVDLIIGLPGEDATGFAAGFDRLWRLAPHEIQLGLLKRLRGTPLTASETAFGMVFNPDPPYDLLANDRLDFATVQGLKRLARFWDLLGNSGRFPTTLPLLLAPPGSPFERFRMLTEALHRAAGTSHGIALRRLCQLIQQQAPEVLGLDPERVRESLTRDYLRNQPKEKGTFLDPPTERAVGTAAGPPARQKRHGAP
ncbi:MAG: DUF4080 domain-containing protein [Magnetococcales bacterium]|nr:DUF4080 domain-containing protein [Magnetococcales bacterium]